MDNVINAFPGSVVSLDQLKELHAMDGAIMEAIKSAKDAGVPQGFIVAILHAHTYQQTAAMVDGND